MPQVFTETDEGKHVMTMDGVIVGSVERVESGKAHVRPSSGLLKGVGSWLSDPWDSTATVILPSDRVDRITETAIVLESMETTLEAGRKIK